MTRAISVILICFAAWMLNGCDDAPSSNPAVPASANTTGITIGYSAPEWGGAQYQIMQGLRQRAQQRGWRVTVVNANFDTSQQLRQIRYLIQSGVKAIVAVPLDSEAISVAAREAREAGVLFYTIDRAPSRGKVNLIVQADNLMAGRQAGEALREMLRARYGEVRGTVLHLRGDLSQTVALEREKGFKEVFSEHPGVEIIDRDTQWQAILFARHTREVLRRQDIDAIYLQSDMIGVPEVLPVLQKLGRLHEIDHPRHIFIVGVDGGPSALEAIRQRLIDAVASQPLTDYGIVVDYIEQELEGRPIQLTAPEEQLAGDHTLHVRPGPHGPLLQMHTTLVTLENVDSPALWGNRVGLVEQTEPDE